MDLLDQLLGHDRWAISRVIDRSRGLTDAQLDQPFDIGHGTLRATLDHLTYNVGFWTELMQGRPIPPRPTHAPSIAELVERHERNYAAFAELARRVRDEGRMDDTLVDHHGDRCTLGITILQVAHHDAQHRAEALHMLRHLGVEVLGDWDPQEWEWDMAAQKA